MNTNAPPAETSDADLERLASRIALLAGDDGEAEAAGRAVGHLARRLGLTGGHLKAIFLAGTNRLAAAGRVAAQQSARADRIEGEAGDLQHSLDQVDLAYRQMSRERDAEREEAARLRAALQRARSAGRVRGALLVVALAAAAGVVGFALFGPPLRPLFGLSYDAASAGAHLAEVRESGAAVLAEPDPASPPTLRLPGGTRLVVERLVWRNFNQWAETRLGGKPGFVAVTSLILQPDVR